MLPEQAFRRGARGTLSGAASGQGRTVCAANGSPQTYKTNEGHLKKVAFIISQMY